MVEKWLLEVQVLMIQSMMDVNTDSLNAFHISERIEWILNWPGQVQI